MATTTVKIVIQSSSALKELQGITRGTDSAAAGERRLAVAAERSARLQVKAAQEKARAAEKAAADEMKAAEKLAAHWRKISERSRAVRERAEAAVGKSAERASALQKKASASAATAAAKAASDKAKADAKAAAESAKTADRELQARLRNLEKLRIARERAEADATRNAKSEAAKRVREEERTIASRRRSAATTIRRAGGVVGGLVAGGVAGGIAAGSAMRNAAGVDDAATRVKKANSFRENLITTSVDAGLTDAEIQGVQAKITSASTKAATAPEEIMGGLSIAHDRFNNLRELSENIEGIALAAKATGTPMEEFIGMLGSAQSAYGLTSKQLKEATDILLAGAAEGAIRPKDFAGPMAAAMGVHAMNTGQSGLEGVRQFVGLMQGIGAGQFGAAETETRGTQFIQQLSRKQVADDLAGIGVKVRKNGKIDVGSVVEQLATNKQFQTPTQRQAIFHDVQAREGIETLIMQRRKVTEGQTGAVDFKSMHGVDAQIGADKTREKITRLESSGLLELQRQAIDMQNDTIANLKAYNDQIVSITKVTNNFEKALGPAGMLLGSIGLSGLVAGGSGALLNKIFGGGTPKPPGLPVAAGAGSAGLLAALGTPVAAASGAALVGTVGAGLAIGGGIGYGADKLTEFATGRGASDRLADILMGSEGLAAESKIREAREPVEINLTHEHKFYDHRTVTTITEKRRDRGATINTAAGPTMPGGR